MRVLHQPAAQLHEAVSKHAPDAHVLVMAAAVADFRPANVATAKIKKTNDTADTPTVDLVRTDDVLAGAVRQRADGQLPNMRAIVGFAAETGDANGDVLFHARKLRRKACGCWWSTRSGTGWRSRSTATTAGCSDPTAPGRPGARFENADGKPYCGRDRHVPAWQ